MIIAPPTMNHIFPLLPQLHNPRLPRRLRHANTLLLPREPSGLVPTVLNRAVRLHCGAIRRTRIFALVRHSPGCFGFSSGRVERCWLEASLHECDSTGGTEGVSLTTMAGHEEEPMVPTKKNASRPVQPIYRTILGGNTLSLVALRNGERGLMAQGEDSSALELFNLDGERIFSDPGFTMVILELGEYAPGDEDGFWALVARI